MIKEIWMPIFGYKGYEASNWGRIKSINYHRTGKEKILRTEKSKTGYLRVGLCKDGKQKKFLVHRLVWGAFNGPIPDNMEINHINEDKTDCRLENLNLMTRTENMNWGTRKERSAKTRSKMVEQYTLDDVYVNTWLNAHIVEKELGHLGFDSGHIWECCSGKRKTHKGYIWKYKEDNSLQDATWKQKQHISLN